MCNISMLEMIKTFQREIKEYMNKRRGLAYLWITNLDILKISILPKLMHRFIEIATKSQQTFKKEFSKLILVLKKKYKDLRKSVNL